MHHFSAILALLVLVLQSDAAQNNTEQLLTTNAIQQNKTDPSSADVLTYFENQDNRRLYPRSIQHLRRRDNLKNYEIIETESGPKLRNLVTNDVTEQMSPHSITGVSKLHARKLNGKGVKIGIIDSGVDYTHLALGGKFCPTCKVAYGHDFVGDRHSATSPPIESDDPKDCEGHGTLIAGIIGAQTPTFVGVAYRATLGAYRIFGCNDAPLSVSIIRNAFDKAYKDGMHVVNLSIGVLPDRIGAPEDFQEQLRGIIDKYTKQGMIAIAAVGNRNQGQDRWSSFVPASLPSVVSVSSMDIPYATTNSFQIHSQEKKSAPFMYLDRCSNYPQPVQEINVVVASPSANPKNCLYPRDIKGKMVLIPPNSCNIEQAIETIKIHGATGAILPNSVINFSDCSFPIVSITIEDANTIQNISKLNPKVALSFSHHRIHIPASKAMKGADHIAWGPSSKLQMNPDIMAPGTMLATTAKKGSTYSINDSQYAVMSGTSYAAPYVTGAAALYLQAQNPPNSKIPRIDPMIFKNATQRTAIPYTIASQGLAGSVPEQGAGLLHIERALLNPFSISPLVIELGDQSIQPQGQNTKRHTIAINNPTNNERVFLVTHLPALSVYGFDKPNEYSDPPTRNKLTAQALFSTTTQSQQDNSGILKKPFIQVKIGPKLSAQVTIDFSIPAGLAYKDHWIYSGYIVADPTPGPYGARSLQAIYAPYFGLNGSLKTINKAFNH